MAIYTNFSQFAAAETVGLDGDGREFYVVVVKATFTWHRGVVSLCDEQPPVTEEDQYAAAPGKSSVTLESDLVPAKPRVDVILAGSIALPTAVDSIDVSLRVGDRINKTARVSGERVWVPGMMRALVPSRPVPFSSMPIVWERCFGGLDPDDARCVEPRNPSGAGLRATAKAMEGLPVPNFEDPRQPMDDWKDHPRPFGFGPIGRHWQPRSKLAGTYDDAWQEERFPLLPLDFDPRFYNSAPEDQQLPSYQPGEEVALDYMTVAGHDRFALPAWQVPITFVGRGGAKTQTTALPDTIVIDPGANRLSLVARALTYPVPNALALRQVRIGVPTPGWLRAEAANKDYIVLGRRGAGR